MKITERNRVVCQTKMASTCPTGCLSFIRFMRFVFPLFFYYFNGLPLRKRKLQIRSNWVLATSLLDKTKKMSIFSLSRLVWLLYLFKQFFPFAFKKVPFYVCQLSLRRVALQFWSADLVLSNIKSGFTCRNVAESVLREISITCQPLSLPAAFNPQNTE